MIRSRESRILLPTSSGFEDCALLVSASAICFKTSGAMPTLEEDVAESAVVGLGDGCSSGSGRMPSMASRSANVLDISPPESPLALAESSDRLEGLALLAIGAGP